MMPSIEELPRAFQTMEKLVKEYTFETILDVGSGEGKHAKYFTEHGKDVTAVDLGRSVNYRTGTAFEGDYLNVQFGQQFDAIWCSHVLEHQRNPGAFLDKMFKDLKEGGILAITVPPRKQWIVGGHVALWNAGTLLYNLILAGFDCSEAILASYGYNISIIVKKKSFMMPQLTYDKGDIELLSSFFPRSLQAAQNFDGDIRSINWDTRDLPEPLFFHGI